MSTVKSPRTPVRQTRAPHIKVTKYEVAVSALTTTAMCAALTLMVMIITWLSNLRPTEVRKPVIMAAGDGGWEDGEPDATPNVESPEDPSTDPSLANEESDVTELEEVTEQVVEVAENAAALVAPNEHTDSKNTGMPGSADGTGGRPLGSGGPGRGGAKREQRWLVEFADKGDLRSYAAQLDFFGIELGALFPADGRLVYMNNMQQPTPTVREIRSAEGDSERRLHMNWGDGSEDRRKADIELYQKAGIDASQASIMHFYPAALEETLATIEQQYGGHSPAEIKRTYFRIRRAGSGFEFYVQNQHLK